jgi:hypothetical protein
VPTLNRFGRNRVPSPLITQPKIEQSVKLAQCGINGNDTGF